MATVGLPLTGAGDSTASVATDLIGSEHYQRMKLHDGADGSTAPMRVKGTTPGSTDEAAIVRPIGSTAFNQAVVGAVGITSGSSAVDLTSAGSTRSVGTVNQGTPAGTSADAWWVRTVTTGSAGGSTTVDANLTSAGSTKTVGVVGQGPASSADFWFTQSIPFSSANIARTSVATSVDASVIAANANRKALVIANGSTAQMVGLGFSTAAVTTARANVNVYLQANSQLRFGMVGDLPLYRGPIRGINLTSTAVTGGVIVTEFT